MGILPEDFKASWQWLHRFRTRKNIASMLLHGEGAEVDKNDPELLSALQVLEAIIANFDPEDVYNIDEIGLFFRLLPRYTLLSYLFVKHYLSVKKKIIFVH